MQTYGKLFLNRAHYSPISGATSKQYLFHEEIKECDLKVIHSTHLTLRVLARVHHAESESGPKR